MIDLTQAMQELKTESKFDPVPEGTYDVQIVDIQNRQNKSNDGKHLLIKFEIISKQQNGRYLWLNINHENPSEAAKKIGLQQLAKLAQACNLGTKLNPDDLVAKRLNVKVTHKGEYVNVSDFKPVTEQDVPF